MVVEERYSSCEVFMGRLFIGCFNILWQNIVARKVCPSHRNGCFMDVSLLQCNSTHDCLEVPLCSMGPISGECV